MSSSGNLSSSSNTSSSIGDTCRLGISLRRSPQEEFQANRIDGFRFTVEAVDACKMPAAIFRFLRRPYNPLTQESADEFDGVCSSVDLEEYPEGAPTGIPPFFRLAQIDLVFRSRAAADDAWRVIQADVVHLVNSLRAQQRLAAAEEVRIEIAED